MAAILLQADDVLVKPFPIEQLTALIDKSRLTSKPSPRPAKESVASILDRDVAITIKRWMSRVEQIAELAAIPLPRKSALNIFPR